MAYYQCRGYVRSVSSDETKVFVTIGANTQMDCNKNKLINKSAGPFAGTIFNIYMELDVTSKLPSPPVSDLKIPANALVLPTSYLVPIKAQLSTLLDSAFEMESTFIIQVTKPDVYELVYIQVGPDNNDD